MYIYTYILTCFFTDCLCFFLRIPTDGFVLADKSTIRFPEPLRNADAKTLLISHNSAKIYLSEPSLGYPLSVLNVNSTLRSI